MGKGSLGDSQIRDKHRMDSKILGVFLELADFWSMNLFIFLMTLGFELRASCLKSRLEPHLQSILLWLFLEMGGQV
jgi:hypothetical protein